VLGMSELKSGMILAGLKLLSWDMTII